MSIIVLYCLHSTSLLSFYIDVVVTLSIDIYLCTTNKANLRDLIAATGLVILLKFDPNHRFFSPCDLESLWIGHLFYTTSSFVHHFNSIDEFKPKLQSGNDQFVSKLAIFFLSRVTFKFDRWPWKTIGQLFYVASSVVRYFKAISVFKIELQSGNAQFGSQSIFCPVWPWNLTDDLGKQ